VGWDLGAVPALQSTAAALRVHQKLLADGMNVAVALVALVFSALMLFHH
jgi:hypothetical protein